MLYFVDLPVPFVTLPHATFFTAGPRVWFHISATGSGNGSTGSSPLRLPNVEAGDDDDELYRDMAS